jgi:hypothetical protein
MRHLAKDIEIDGLLAQIRSETDSIKRASDRIVRLQSEIYKIQKHKERLESKVEVQS